MPKGLERIALVVAIITGVPENKFDLEAFNHDSR